MADYRECVDRSMYVVAAAAYRWLTLERASKKWRMPIREWDLAMQQLDIHFAGRLGL